MARLTSKVTARSQTTLPTGVRKALGIESGDRLVYVIKGNRAVISRAPAPEPEDPALAGFLDLLSRDLTEYPERVKALPSSLIDRLRASTAGVRFDRDEPIEGDVAL